jgi:gamma-glutamylcyclotransferase (GGCT)/AIG2-like uncharacterized protein YtfP
MSLIPLFVYGTLLDPAVQHRIIGRLVAGEEDSLHGFALASVSLQRMTYPNIIAHPQAVVAGRCIELSAAELDAVDRYETEAYVREQVRLGSGRDAWVYRVVGSYEISPLVSLGVPPR